MSQYDEPSTWNTQCQSCAYPTREDIAHSPSCKEWKVKINQLLSCPACATPFSDVAHTDWCRYSPKGLQGKQYTFPQDINTCAYCLGHHGQHARDCALSFNPQQPNNNKEEQDKRFRELLQKTLPTQPAPMQEFASGATRSDDSNKIDYEGFLSPLVLEAYGRYMTEHKIQDDGRARASDNWSKGIPFHKYIKSLFRHFVQLWQLHRGYPVEAEKRAGKPEPVTVESAMCGILFNTMGYFHEYLMSNKAWQERIISEPEGADLIGIGEIRKKVA